MVTKTVSGFPGSAARGPYGTDRASYEWSRPNSGRHLTPLKAMLEEAVSCANVREKQENDPNI